MSADALPAPVQAALAAANAHDVEAFLAVFTPDGVVDDWGREFRGREPIRGWSDAEFIGVDVTLDVTAAAERGGETVVTADVGGRGFNGESHFAFRVEGDRVARMTIRA
ncbi:MAG TPA: nuclear transport factor 2 family protein [Baekduia sp.]